MKAISVVRRQALNALATQAQVMRPPKQLRPVDLATKFEMNDLAE
jgi:hypothetical protein